MAHQLRDSWLRALVDFDNNWQLFSGLVAEASLAGSSDRPELQCVDPTFCPRIGPGAPPSRAAEGIPGVSLDTPLRSSLPGMQTPA